MLRSKVVSLSALVLACAGTVLASEKALQSPTENATFNAQTSSTAALVYVSSGSAGAYEIHGYSAASNGALSAVPGSPLPENGWYLATNGKWLFSTDSGYIYSFSIASDGALSQVSDVFAQQYNSSNTGGPMNLFFDRTGTTLYDEDIYGNGPNNTYQFFSVNQTTGALTYKGATSSYSAVWVTPLSLTGNNTFGYGASCVRGGEYIYGFRRSGNGTLTGLNITPKIPTTTNGGYCPYLAAADQNNHIAVSLTPMDVYTQTGPAQIAVYTADTYGNLTTTSTSDNMPKVSVGTILNMCASPSGQYLAVGGSSGLQFFHFNGANAITKLTGARISTEIDQVFWDNSSHVYAISRTAGKLYVFTVSSTGATEAAGSPYSIPQAQNIVVLPK